MLTNTRYPCAETHSPLEHQCALQNPVAGSGSSAFEKKKRGKKKGKEKTESGTIDCCMDITDSMPSTLVNRKALDMDSVIRSRRLNFANSAFKSLLHRL